jgi:phage terminase large subunit-like protein
LQPQLDLYQLSLEEKRRVLALERERSLRQKDWIRSTYRALPTLLRFHQAQEKIALILGGNRSGKTEGNVGDLVMCALDCHPYQETRHEKRYWYGTLDWSYLGAVFYKEKLKKMLPERFIEHIAWHNKAREIPEIIKLTNGKEITCKSYDAGPAKFQAASVDRVYLDEQIPHNGEEIFRECRMRTIDTGGKIRWSFTPVIPDQAWLKSIVECPPPEHFVDYANLNDNRKSRGGYVDDKEIDLLIAEWPESVRQTRIEGKFAGFEGLVFPGFNPSIHLEWVRLLPLQWTWGISIDFGYNNPFCALLYAIDHDGEIWFAKEHYLSHTLLKEHAEVLKLWLAEYPVRHIWCDHDAQDRAEIESYIGRPTSAAVKDVRMGIEAVGSALEVKLNGRSGLHVFRVDPANPGFGCPNLIAQFGSYRWAEKHGDKNAPDEPLKLNDHAIDAARYAVKSELKKSNFQRETGGLC